MFTPTRGNDPIWLIFFIFQRGWIQPTRLIFPKFFLMAWCCHLYYSMRKNIHGFGFRCCKIPWDFLEEKLAKKANLCKSCKSAVDSVQVEKFWSISGERVPPVSRREQRLGCWKGSTQLKQRYLNLSFFILLVFRWCWFRAEATPTCATTPFFSTPCVVSLQLNLEITCLKNTSVMQVSNGRRLFANRRWSGFGAIG